MSSKTVSPNYKCSCADPAPPLESFFLGDLGPNSSSQRAMVQLVCLSQFDHLGLGVLVPIFHWGWVCCCSQGHIGQTMLSCKRTFCFLSDYGGTTYLSLLVMTDKVLALSLFEFLGATLLGFLSVFSTCSRTMFARNPWRLASRTALKIRGQWQCWRSTSNSSNCRYRLGDAMNCILPQAGFWDSCRTQLHHSCRMSSELEETESRQLQTSAVKQMHTTPPSKNITGSFCLWN